MCLGDNPACAGFREHRAALLGELDRERHRAGRLQSIALIHEARPLTPPKPAERLRLHHLPATDQTVHWGYFSRDLRPQVYVEPGDFVTIETLTHHAGDDAERMIEGDQGAESVFQWSRTHKAVARRGAGAADAAIGGGAGLGVHICTGPVHVAGAMPGDVLEVRVLEVAPRPAGNPAFPGATFGSNAAANWGFHYNDMITGDRPREVVTIYQIDSAGREDWARAVYSFRWVPQVDPAGVVHATIDYPGVVVDHALTKRNWDVLRGVRIPIRPHFGVMVVAPREPGLVSTIPPAYFGGNMDNWRLGAGASAYFPVAVEGALFSAGDPHASQGDSELCGTAIECSLTGTFQFILHKADQLGGTMLEGLDHPMIETANEWALQGFSFANYLAELGAEASSEIFRRSSIDLAMRDAFRKVRRFLMTAKGLTEDEAISLMSVAVDFGVTQVVDGNWGVHAIVRKDLFVTEAA
jgi:acetamidase/formamidase